MDVWQYLRTPSLGIITALQPGENGSFTQVFCQVDPITLEKATTHSHQVLLRKVRYLVL